MENITFLANFSQGTFLKNGNTPPTLTEKKQKKFYLDLFCHDKKIFVSFAKLLKITLDNKNLICRDFTEAEIILFCKYAKFRKI